MLLLKRAGGLTPNTTYRARPEVLCLSFLRPSSNPALRLTMSADTFGRTYSQLAIAFFLSPEAV